MLNLEKFDIHERVFVLLNAGEWIGVEIVGKDLDEGLVYVKVVWTNDIPGYEVGSFTGFNVDRPAAGHLTVQDAINATYP